MKINLIKTDKKGRKKFSRSKVWFAIKAVEFGINTLVPAIKQKLEEKKDKLNSD